MLAVHIAIAKRSQAFVLSRLRNNKDIASIPCRMRFMIVVWNCKSPASAACVKNIIPKDSVISIGIKNLDSKHSLVEVKEIAKCVH